MCGFVGLIDNNNTDGKHTGFINYALHDLHRRGPDSQLAWQSEQGNVQLGFARLAIRDLSDAGNQPMQSVSNRYTIVYNGETYNTNELIAWASVDIQKLKGHSDTEIILACIEQKGVVETVKRMDGIFAIALYDQQESKLYCIRDHAGVKPLYLGINTRGAVFSSHYHHITSHEFFKSENINVNGLVNYFKFGFVQEGEGLLQNTYFVPHGHITTIDTKTLDWSWEPYFELNPAEEKKSVSTSVLQEKYTKIVESQLVSDVPIGCFLSGGVDSTITAGIASIIQSNITAFTIGVDDEKLDETTEAKRFASYFKINHIVHKISTQEILNSLDDYIESLAEPLADYSSLVTLKVCELAKEKLTVVLSGDGGDELFWGYPRFQKALQYKSFLRSPRWWRWIHIGFSKILGVKVSMDLMKYNSFDDYYLAKQGLTGNSVWVSGLLNVVDPIQDPYLYVHAKNKEIKSELDRAKQYEYDIHMQRVLLKVDRASMYHSLEVRTPLLSKKMVELSMGFEEQDCMNKVEGKLPLRKMLQNLIPKGERNSGEKKGFSPPMASWMRNELKAAIEKRIFEVPARLKTYINVIYLQKLWNEHQGGKYDHSWSIWAVFSLFTWVDLKMNANAY